MSTDPSVTVHVNIGTSETVDALVHRYIQARTAELDAAKQAERTARYAIDRLLEGKGDELLQSLPRLAALASALGDLPGASPDCYLVISNNLDTHLDIQRRMVNQRPASLEIPVELHLETTQPEFVAALTALKAAHRASEAVVAAIHDRIKREGGAEALRGEMLARLVESQAPLLATTISDIIGGNRLLTTTEGA